MLVKNDGRTQVLADMALVEETDKQCGYADEPKCHGVEGIKFLQKAARKGWLWKCGRMGILCRIDRERG